MRFLKSFIVLLALVSIAFSQGAPAAYSSVAPVVGFYANTLVDGVGDTLKTKTDSVLLFSDQIFASGYEYILSRGAITFAGTDSVKVQLRLQNKRNMGLIYVDSFVLGDAEQIILPINRTSLGDKFDAELIGYGNNNTKLILPKIELLKRRAQGGDEVTESRYRGRW